MRSNATAFLAPPEKQRDRPIKARKRPSPLAPPATGKIPVAFAISDGAVVISSAARGKFFKTQHHPTAKAASTSHSCRKERAHRNLRRHENPAQLHIRKRPAPESNRNPRAEWRQRSHVPLDPESSKAADLTMSVCTGAFVLAKTGLLSGKSATTHHYAYTELALQHPDIHVKRGYRFVEEGKIATAGGLTSGMDLALRVVERYYGRDQAMRTALNMESRARAGSTPPAHPTPSTPKLNPAPDSPAKSPAWNRRKITPHLDLQGPYVLFLQPRSQSHIRRLTRKSPADGHSKQINPIRTVGL